MIICIGFWNVQSGIFHRHTLISYTLPSCIEDCEDIEHYEPGGYHPVLLDDVYDDNRYKIIHKLGSAGFSTVWLACDFQRDAWVALKFIKAKESAEYDARSSAITKDPDLLHSDLVVHVERRFWVNGPNRHHLCFVLGLVGPNLATLSNGIYSRLTPAFEADVSPQATRAMDFLHAHDKSHGGEL